MLSDLCVLPSGKRAELKPGKGHEEIVLVVKGELTLTGSSPERSGRAGGPSAGERPVWRE